MAAKSPHSIIDWLYSRLSNDDFRSTEELQKAVEALADSEAGKGNGRLNRYLEVNDDWQERKSETGRILSDEVKELNERYLEKNRSDIALEDRPDALLEIEPEKEYEQETIDTIKAERNEKIQRLRTIEKREFGRSARERIGKIDDLNEYETVKNELREKADELNIKTIRDVYGKKLDRKQREITQRFARERLGLPTAEEKKLEERI